MNNTRSTFVHKDGYLKTTLQILIASFTFLFTSIFGRDMISRGIYMLIENNILPASVFESYFLTGIIPEVILNLISAFLILMLYKKINKKPISTMGVTSITKNMKLICGGMLTLIVLLSCITAVLYFVGDIKFTGLEFNISILQYVLLMASVSFVEEVLNRGFIQHLVKSRTYTLWSLVVPSIVFTLFHIVNPGITFFAVINIFLAGFFFSLITYKTGNIWFGFGAHLIWNVGSACIFGLMDVSSVTGSILNFEYTKLTTFNGFGISPLNGVVGTIAWIAAIFIFSKIKMKKAD
ncbi:MAG: type II CAAX endopeptidase family protein [Clostridium sp.]|nr:type II CAAX endopeptidase family protein [Clostridium sp.]